MGLHFSPTVKPIDSYLDEELSSPIEMDVDQPKTLIVAKKPSPKVQKSAAARVENQKMVSRQEVHSIDDVSPIHDETC